MNIRSFNSASGSGTGSHLKLLWFGKKSITWQIRDRPALYASNFFMKLLIIRSAQSYCAARKRLQASQTPGPNVFCIANKTDIQHQHYV